MNCTDCGQKIDILNSFNDRCGPCHSDHLKANVAKISVQEFRANKTRNVAVDKPAKTADHRDPSLYRGIVLTTETAHNLCVEKRLEIISAEVVVGMNVFKDIFAGVRNFTGGRSKTIQKALKDIRIQALDELKREAFSIQADAVVGVSLNYQEIGATGSTMLILVATGTGVKLTDANL
ncbi:MAG: YbjQ family protein [Paracoccaceae bacterium]